MMTLLSILERMKARPGMYFSAGDHSRSIHWLDAFITGFNCGRSACDAQGDLDFFTEWVAAHYRVLAEGRNSFRMILEHVAGDDRKAFDEFFNLLPMFVREREQIGREGILARFSTIQDELLEEFRKSLGD